MTNLAASVDRIAHETAFSGVVRVDRNGRVELVKPYGLAHRSGIGDYVDEEGDFTRAPPGLGPRFDGRPPGA